MLDVFELVVILEVAEVVVLELVELEVFELVVLLDVGLEVA